VITGSGSLGLSSGVQIYEPNRRVVLRAHCQKNRDSSLVNSFQRLIEVFQTEAAPAAVLERDMIGLAGEFARQKMVVERRARNVIHVLRIL
jgi:hypothetical protein